MLTQSNVLDKLTPLRVNVTPISVFKLAALVMVDSMNILVLMINTIDWMTDYVRV